jgi:hypothetical protein
MKAKARQLAASPKIIFAVLLGATLTFNNWFLAFFLNRPLFLGGGAVSEFSALGQPFTGVFRSLDIVSGLLFMAAAVLLLQYQKVHGLKTYYILILLTAVFGVANSVDALIPLNCAVTLGATCDSPVRLGLSHFSVPGHGYSSVIIALCYLALPLTGYVFAVRAKLSAFKTVSLALLAIAAVSLVAAGAEYLLMHTFSERAWGPSQELQMVAFSLWFIAWYAAILPKHSVPLSSSLHIEAQTPPQFA